MTRMFAPNVRRFGRLVALATLVVLGVSACQSSSVKEEPAAAGTQAGAQAAGSDTTAVGEQAERCAALQKHVQLMCRSRGRSRTQNVGVGGRSSPECMTARMDMQKACTAG